MRYPKAGELQRELGVELTDNPCPKGNPWEVRSDSGLEGVFAREEDAESYADELRRSGANGVKAKKYTRTAALSRQSGYEQNPSHRKFREGTRVIFRPTPVSRMMYSGAPPEGAVGVVTTVPLPGGRGSFLPGPGGGIVYVDWDLYPVQGVSPIDLEVDEVVERAKRVAQPSKHRKNPDESGEDTDILEGMARALWLTSYADYVEELEDEDEKDELSPGPGGDWDHVAPETPESAYEAARDLYLLIERANGKPPGELFQRACEVDGCEWNSDNAETFGHYLAMQSLGHGVSWFDDHKKFALKLPHFEAHYYGTDVGWSPQVRSRQNPPRELREKYGDATDIVIESRKYGYSGWLENRQTGNRAPISFGGTKPETMREAMGLARKFLAGVHGRSNPTGLTAKGERMYKHVKTAYGRDPRAAEIASRTVLARAKTTRGLKK